MRPDMRAMMDAGGGRFGPPGFGGPPGGDRPGFGQPGFGRPGSGRPNGETDGEKPSPEAMVARMMQFDSNADGKLAKDELPEEAQARMVEADADNDGYATKDELIAMAKKMTQRAEMLDAGPRPLEMIDRLFKESDANDDGKLTKDELPERMAERFNDMDSNGDGSLDREELTTAMRRFRGRGGSPPENGGRERPGRPSID